MKLEVFVDYTCPFCFLAENYLRQIISEHPEIELTLYVSEAHPAPEPRMTLKESSWWHRVLGNPAKANGIKINVPHSPVPRSDIAIQGLKFLESENIDTTLYSQRMFDAVYVTSENIEDIDVVLAQMKGLGADLEKARTALESGAFKPQQQRENEFSYIDNQITVVPTFLFDNRRMDATPALGVTKQQILDFLNLGDNNAKNAG